MSEGQVPSGRTRFRSRALAARLVIILGAMVAGGCENAGQGAATGAGVGALSGLAIGSMSGNAGRGAATGAIVGGVGGAVIGDQNRRQNTRPVPVAPPPPPPAASQQQVVSQPPAQLSSADRDRLALAQFARTWRVSGWETVDGQRRFVTGTAVGSVENAFFVRLDINVRDDQTGRLNTGNVIFASEPGRGLTMNSRFDTSPSPVTFAGNVTADGSLFTLDEIAPGFGPNGRRIVIRFISPDEWVADESERSGGRTTAIGSLTFSGAR